MKIGFIGAGNMGGAILKGIAAADGDISKKDLGFFDPSEAIRDQLSAETGTAAFEVLEKLVEWSDMILICVKPQIYPSIAQELHNYAKVEKIFVSIMAGVTLESLHKTLGSDHTIVRTMPNVPLSVGQGAVAIATDALQEDTLTKVESVFNAVGTTARVTEAQMDAVTGLSGSGPAFVFEFLESMIQGGVKMGLSRPQATALTLQTVSGCAEMVKQGSVSPAELVGMVTSPAGTTIHGLHELTKSGMRAGVISAVESAALRSAELGKK